ncbi:MAG: ethanolamine ammonia-lyase reactivating factor EutA [Oscillospiraceae bacterium]|nr:ethanolamine ammonia-lyase reactivating factor EutA [Oscillospiraceae bacterium]
MANTLLSVGIDIGTSTTQVIFSKLTLEDLGGRFTAPNIAITKKEVIYRGEIHETPLLNHSLIDTQALCVLVEGEFRQAGFAVGATDTGAVIITGESARRENAAAVLQQLSGFAGEFVVATAGPDLESRIAGQGSGAQAYAQEHGLHVVNFDIGGGTTNVAVFDCGKLTATACYDIGGRLLKFTPQGKLIYLSEHAEKIAQTIGLCLRVADTPSLADLRALAQAMAQQLEVNTCELLTPNSVLLFSGGVADCIYRTGHELFAYNDFGVLLGQAVRNSRLFGYQVLAPQETIRATVMGAGSYTTTLSGSTIGYTHADLFPLKNLPVFALSPQQEQDAFDHGKADDFAHALCDFVQQTDANCVAIAFAGKPSPGWQELKRLAQALQQAASQAQLDPNIPWVFLAQHDIGKALGLAMTPYAQGRAVITLDGIDARQPDCYLDIGKPLMNGQVVPVVIKTLLFG